MLKGACRRRVRIARLTASNDLDQVIAGSVGLVVANEERDALIRISLEGGGDAAGDQWPIDRARADIKMVVSQIAQDERDVIDRTIENVLLDDQLGIGDVDNRVDRVVADAAVK